MAEQRYPGNSVLQEFNQPLGAADKLLASPKASWISWRLLFISAARLWCCDKEIELSRVK